MDGRDIAFLFVIFSECLGLFHAENSPNPETLTMCILMETDLNGAVYDYKKLGAAFDLALEYANESILPTWLSIRKVYQNLGTVCSEKTGIIARALELRDRGVQCHAYIGPGCGLAGEVLHGLADFLNIPIFGCPCAGMGQSAPSSAFPLLTRVSYSYTAIAEVIMRFFTYQNYTTPVFFQDDTLSFYNQMGLLTQTALLRSNNSLLVYQTKFVKFLSKDFVDDSVMRQLLINASVGSRVFFLLADGSVVRQFMITASKLGMTSGDYVFMGLELYQSTVWGSFSYFRNDSDDSIAREAYKTLLLFSLDVGLGNDITVFWDDFARLAKAKYQYVFEKNFRQIVDPVVLHGFDAVLLYTSLVTEMAAKGLNYTSGYDLSGQASGFSFVSPVSGVTIMDQNGDRSLTYLMQSYEFRSGKHYGALGFPPAPSSQVIILGQIDWPGTNNTGLPPNTPRCGFRNENRKCIPERRTLTKSEKSAVVIVPLICAAILGFAGYRALQKFLLEGTDPYWWRILKQDLQINLGHGLPSVKSMNSGISGTTEDVSTVEGDGSTGKMTASYNGAVVTVLPLQEPYKRVSAALPKEAARVRNLLHPNIQRFIGVVVNEDNLCELIIGEACRKGTLKDLLENERVDLDINFKYSLLKNLASGMTFLHSSAVVSHGYLNDMNCQIDSQFVLRIAGYGLESLRNAADLAAVAPVTEERDYRVLLWRAPELLRSTMPPAGSQKGDVYSFAILMQQIFLRSEPFQRAHNSNSHKKNEDAISYEEIIMDVRHGLVPPLRPPVPMSACPPNLHALMENCWDEAPAVRPTFAKVRSTLKSITGKAGESIVDHLIQRIGNYTTSLEHQIEIQTRSWMEERQRVQLLMQDILPPAIAEALTSNQLVKPQSFHSVTVYFGDISGLRDIVPRSFSPMEVVMILNQLYVVFSETVHQFEVVKIGTANSDHMVASGLSPNSSSSHVEHVASFALAFRKDVAHVNSGSSSGKRIQLRAGFTSGPCVSGIIGTKLPQYILFGETVSAARHLEQSGEAGKIQCSLASKLLLDVSDAFILVPTGRVEKIKDHADGQETFWLVGKN